jgi:hypothetical protein
MRAFLIILLVFTSCNLFAQKKVQKDSLHYDSSAISQLHFSDSAFNAYNNNKDFQYETKLVETPSLWDRFWAWFWKLIFDFLNSKVGEITTRIFYWAVGVGAVIFFVFKVTRMNRLAMFSKDSLGAIPYNIDSEDIHAIPFDEAINEALKNGDYRFAIRLLYLQNLKLLADKELILWQPNKTNTDYLRELTDDSTRQVFKNVTNIFEYAWYGSHAVSNHDYSIMKDELTNFQNRL